MEKDILFYYKLNIQKYLYFIFLNKNSKTIKYSNNQVY